MDCNICKFNNNCEPKTKALWIYGEGRDILGCNMGEPDKLKIIKIIESLQKHMKNKITNEK